VVPGADPEGERDDGDDHERLDHLAETRADFPPPVETADPEHEHRDHRQERKPVRLRPPHVAPERRPLTEVQLAQRQRDEHAERQPREVEHDERGDARKPAETGEQRPP
jgi:hypothetical protein